MPIVTNSDSLASKLNGDVSNSLFNSLEDESFVVLERLTANDPVPQDVQIQSLNSFQAFSNSCSFPVFNNISTSGLGSNSTLHQSQIEASPVGPQCDSNNLSVGDIQKQLQEVLQENVNLKENLFQTNLAMKQHMSTVRLLQDRASEVQKNHQSKFEETKALILQLRLEKNELQEANGLISGELKKARQEIKEIKEANLAFGNEMAKILSENDSLKQQLSRMQENTETENNKKTSLQPTAKEIELHELADQLTRKLEGVERSRRQQEFDIDRLKAQLGRTVQELNDTQRKLALAENALQVTKEKPLAQIMPTCESSSLNYREMFVKYNKLLNELATSAQEELTRGNSLSSWVAADPVQIEISDLRRLLSEEQALSVARKESISQAVSAIHELLNNYKKIAEELELQKADCAAKESHTLAYDTIQKKGFTEKLDALTAKLVETEEELAISKRHLASYIVRDEENIRLHNMQASLQETVCLQNADKKESAESLNEQLQALSGEMAVKDEKLKSNCTEINFLKSEVERLRSIAETVSVFEEQAKIYQDDFEAERESRESLVAEKERLLEDLRHLERRNKELIEELNGQRGQSNDSFVPPNRQNPSLSPAPSRLHLELEKSPNLNEKQIGDFHVQHCLNSLLQGADFNTYLSQFAQESGLANMTRLDVAGTSSKDSIEQALRAVDSTGHFPIQLMSRVLELWGLEVVPYSDTQPIDGRKAFICSSHSHWFSIRRLENQWFNFDTTLKQPELIPDERIGFYLDKFQREGKSVFIVLSDTTEKSIVSPVTSRKRKCTSKELARPSMDFHLSLKNQNIHQHSPRDCPKLCLPFPVSP